MRFAAVKPLSYIPGRYISEIKRPGGQFIRRGIIQDDFVLWVLSSIDLATRPLTHCIGLSCLLISFWAIYELGYVDNDVSAVRYEAAPNLSRAVESASQLRSGCMPWLWSTVFGAIGVILLRWPDQPNIVDFVSWSLLIMATYCWFGIYNRVDKLTRVWMYPGLQFARCAAFVVLVPVSLVGAIAIGAHVLARWVPYYIYRHGSKQWPAGPFGVVRLLFFLVLSISLTMFFGISALVNVTFVAVLAWVIIKARHELAAAVRHAYRLDRAKTTRRGERP